MNPELALKIQAYLDGELPSTDHASIQRLLDTDAAAQALLTELKSTTAALASNEPEHLLPESRDFFYSKVARDIARLNVPKATPAPSLFSPPSVRWLKWSIPVAGLAVVILAFLLVRPTVLTTSAPPQREAEISIADTTGFAFHSETEGMTVVWVQSDVN